MNCQRCGYLLFNLPRPQCPECGEGFNIERYRFAPGSVSFRCPHCDQAYYGNDEGGLPWPREFECVHCHQRVLLANMRVVPQVPDARGWTGSTWDNRKLHGFWRAWWQTTKALLFRPSSFYGTHAGVSNWEAFLYSIVSSYVGIAPVMAYQAVFTVGLLSMMVSSGGAAPTPAPWWIFAIVFGIFAAVVPIVAVLVGAALGTLTTHLALLLLAPERRPIDYTFRTVLYSYGTNVTLAVPVCGAYAGGIWQLVALIIGIREAHRIGTGRAVIAVLWPLTILLPAYIAVMLFFVLMAGRS